MLKKTNVRCANHISPSQAGDSMKGPKAPSEDDYTRLNRAVSGILAILFAYVWIVFAVTLSDDWLVETPFFVLYSAIPVIGLVALYLKPLTRQNDPQGDRFVRVSKIARRATFWLGLGHIALAVVCLLAAQRDWRSATMPLILIGGVVWLCWSLHCARVARPSGDWETRRGSTSDV
jgi:hypothetical protein